MKLTWTNWTERGVDRYTHYRWVRRFAVLPKRIDMDTVIWLEWYEQKQWFGLQWWDADYGCSVFLSQPYRRLP